MTTQINLEPGLQNRKPRFKPRKALGQTFSYGLAISAVLIFIYPIVWLISASLKPNFEIYREPLRLIPSEFQFDVYLEVWNTTPMISYMLNSVTYALGGAIITVFFSMLAAYSLSRHFFRGKRLFLTLLLAVQLVPGLVRVIPIFVMMDRLGLINTRVGIIILYGAGGIAYATWFLKGYFDAIPQELDEAAAMDGASRFRIIWQILMPSLVPGLAALLILQFIGHWNDFTTASVLLRDPALLPLTVGTFQLIGPDESDFRLLAAASLMNIIPILLVFTILQRYLVSGLTSGAVKN